MDIHTQIQTFEEYYALRGKLRTMEESGLDLICGEPDIRCIEDELDIAGRMYQIRRNRYPVLISA